MSKKRKSHRVVTHSIHERSDPKMRQKHKKYVADLMAEVALHVTKVPEKVLSLFGEERYDLMANLLQLPPRPPVYLGRDEWDDELRTDLNFLTTRALSAKSLESEDSTDSMFLKKKDGGGKWWFYDLEELSAESLLAGSEKEAEEELTQATETDDDLVVEPPSDPPKPPEDILKDYRSPYQKFFSLPEEKAARWRSSQSDKEKKPKTLDEEGEFVTSQIAKDFVNWMKSIGLESVRINETTVKELFQVGLDNPATKSICIDMKELPAPPKHLTDAYKFYDKSERAALHRQILWDHYAENRPIPKTAFGKGRATSTIRIRNKKAEWLSTSVIPKEMITGESLWKELEGYDVVTEYCKWLNKNPSYPKPLYLIETGKFQEVDKKKKRSLITQMLKKAMWSKRGFSRQMDAFDLSSFQKRETNFLKGLPNFGEIRNLMATTDVDVAQASFSKYHLQEEEA